MTLTLQERVEVLEVKVETLETNAGPGRADAHAGNLADLRTQFAKFGEVQAKQSQTLDIHTGKFNSLDRSMVAVRLEVGRLRTDLTEFKNEASGKLERLDNDVAWLKDAAGRQEGLIIALSTDAADLKDDINGLTIKVDKLQEDVAGLKADFAGFKVEVRGTLAEILDRLPAKAA